MAPGTGREWVARRLASRCRRSSAASPSEAAVALAAERPSFQTMPCGVLARHAWSAPRARPGAVHSWPTRTIPALPLDGLPGFERIDRGFARRGLQSPAIGLRLECRHARRDYCLSRSPRSTTRFADLPRRSFPGIQALLERPLPSPPPSRGSPFLRGTVRYTRPGRR